MKKFLYSLGLAALFGLVTAPFMPGTAVATPSATPMIEGCKTGWYVNDPDEMNRKPESTETGFKFQPADLVHREITGVTVENIQPGTFALAAGSDGPDQDSFFSVEVNSGPGTYATLRWNTATNKWNMVTGGQFYENVSAAALVEMPPSKKSHTVISFGVGYTQNPPGTKTVTVKSVTFKGNTYDMTCPKVTSPSASASASKSPSASTSSSSGVYYATCDDAPYKLVKGVDPGYRAGLDSDGDGTACDSRGDKPSLPVTGVKMPILIGGGIGLLAVGGGALWFARRNRTRFTA